MEPTGVKQWLAGEERFAPDVDEVWAAVSAGSQRRTVTRRRFVVGGVAAGVAAIATGTTLARRGSDHPALPDPSPTPTPSKATTSAVPRSTTTGRSTSQSPSTTAGRSTSQSPSTTPSAVVNRAGTAAAVARGHWRSLPAAPIPALSAPVAVWSGTEMLVWGSPDDGVSTAGVAYDPHRRSWRKLPPAPVGVGAGGSGIWTGTAMIRWGGAHLGGQAVRPTGARYTPSTNQWQLLPNPPTGTSAGTQAVWTGSTMVALAIPAGDQPERIDAASYDPVTDTWSPLPSIALPAGHPVLQMKLAAGPGSVLLLSQWQHSGSFTTAGTDCYILANKAWRPVIFSGGSGPNSSDPFWAGTVFLQPAAVDWSGIHSMPAAMKVTGRLLDPATGHVSDMPHGPIDDYHGRSIWTGSALMSFDTSTFTSGGGRTHYPGEAAVWDPTTKVWTSLPTPGIASYEETAAVWTGSSLLMWGHFYHSKDANSPNGAKPFAAGLEFVSSP